MNIHQSTSPSNQVKSLREISFKIFIFSTLTVLVIHYLWLIQISASPKWATDYLLFYLSGEQTLKQEDFYYPLLFFTDSHAKAVNLNPPLMGILMVPFGLLRYTPSFWAWSIFGLALGILSTLLIIKKIIQPKNYMPYLVGTLLTLAYFPIFLNTKSGQLGTLVFFLTTMGWLSFREKKEGWAGFFWGMAFSIKLFIGLFLWMLLLRKEWRTLKIFLLTSIICGSLSLLIFNPDIYLHYLGIFKQIHWYTTNWNASLLGFFARLFGYNDEPNLVIFHLPQLTSVLYGVSASILLFSFTFFKKNYAKKSLLEVTLSNDLIIAYTIITMLLISPLGWVYYFPLLFIPFAIIFYWNQKIFHRSSLHYLLASAIFFSSAPSLLMKPLQILHLRDIFLSSGVYFYSLCILIIILFKLNTLLNKHRAEKTSDALIPSAIAPWILTALYTTALSLSFMGIIDVTHLISLAK